MEEKLLKGKTILVVDDENDLRDIVSSELEFLGAKTFQAENITRASDILQKEKIDLVISDIKMPGGTGIDLLDSLKKTNAITPSVILITGFADITLENALDKGAEALVNKPFKLDDLIKMVVRFTAPVQKRFQEGISSNKKIVFNIKNDQINFGRGGICLSFNQERTKLKQGDVIDFELHNQEKFLQGTGVCRWVKIPEDSSQGSLCGLEFYTLSSDGLKNFMQLHDPSIVPYIPLAPESSL